MKDKLRSHSASEILNAIIKYNQIELFSSDEWLNNYIFQILIKHIKNLNVKSFSLNVQNLSWIKYGVYDHWIKIIDHIMFYRYNLEYNVNIDHVRYVYRGLLTLLNDIENGYNKLNHI